MPTNQELLALVVHYRLELMYSEVLVASLVSVLVEKNVVDPIPLRLQWETLLPPLKEAVLGQLESEGLPRAEIDALLRSREAMSSTLEKILRATGAVREQGN